MGCAVLLTAAVHDARGDGHPLQHQLVEGPRRPRPLQPHPPARRELGAPGDRADRPRRYGPGRPEPHHTPAHLKARRTLGQPRRGPHERLGVDSPGPEQRLEVRDDPQRRRSIRVEGRQP
ncbi:hypothetical protein QFZ24_006145 [Streptomyces phaeochromogenes]|uniref:hypothetical protein n=1 Tax=Streptomyces phaeochromogenes TaxID=1923 RepID=UPI002794B0E5|nr:hypothetical protein [Streptomyces phaeochromogenes]MDQ0952222.1 hypothetical protein [Streptomyces phaeochromogenes]